MSISSTGRLDNEDKSDFDIQGYSYLRSVLCEVGGMFEERCETETAVQAFTDHHHHNHPCTHTYRYSETLIHLIHGPGTRHPRELWIDDAGNVSFCNRIARRE